TDDPGAGTSAPPSCGSATSAACATTCTRRRTTRSTAPSGACHMTARRSTGSRASPAKARCGSASAPPPVCRRARGGLGISPGLSIDYGSWDDRADLARKIDQVVGVGVDLVCLALDDIPFGGREQGVAHADLTKWLREHLGDRASLLLVPTEYVGTAPTPYLDALAAGVPADVPIAWTGRYVVNGTITVADAEARAAALGDR